jgi:hypothetical protein
METVIGLPEGTTESGTTGELLKPSNSSARQVPLQRKMKSN